MKINSRVSLPGLISIDVFQGRVLPLMLIKGTEGVSLDVFSFSERVLLTLILDAHFFRTLVIHCQIPILSVFSYYIFTEQSKRRIMCKRPKQPKSSSARVGMLFLFDSCVTPRSHASCHSMPMKVYDGFHPWVVVVMFSFYGSIYWKKKFISSKYLFFEPTTGG